jgi:hypothetical protein
MLLVGCFITERYRLAQDRPVLCRLAAHWVYPGPAKVHRTVLPYPLSSNGGRYRRLKDDLAPYRLTFGQPRQEDLFEVLKQRGVRHDAWNTYDFGSALNTHNPVIPHARCS